MKTLRTTLGTAICSIALLGLATVANAQTTTVIQYDSPYCGAMVNGTWVPTGACNTVTDVGSYARVAGTIIFVRGHLVTLQQANRQIVINDQPALDMQDTGRVAVGRSVEALGYWHNGVFFATTFVSTP